MGCTLEKPEEIRDYDPDNDGEILTLAITPHYAEFTRHNGSAFMNLHCNFYNHTMRFDIENTYFNVHETSTNRNIHIPSRYVIEFVDALMKRHDHKYTITITKMEKGGLMTFAVVQ